MQFPVDDLLFESLINDPYNLFNRHANVQHVDLKAVALHPTIYITAQY